MLDEATWEHAGEKSHEEEKEHRKELSHCLAEVLTVHLLTLLTSILLLSLLLLRRPSVPALGLVAEKHEVEEFFRVDKVIVSELVKVTTMEVMATPASAARTSRLSSLESIGIPKLVILAALGSVWETRHGSINFLKSLISLRWAILIGMYFQTLLPVGFLEFFVVTIPLYAKNVVVVLVPYYISCYFLLFCSKFPLLRLRSRTSGWCGRWTGSPRGTCWCSWRGRARCSKLIHLL